MALNVLGPQLFHGVGELLLVANTYVLLMLFINVFMNLLITLAPFALFLAVPFVVTFSMPLTLLTPVCLFRSVALVRTFGGAFQLKFTA